MESPLQIGAGFLFLEGQNEKLPLSRAGAYFISGDMGFIRNHQYSMSSIL